jgi:hypothetical protein
VDAHLQLSQSEHLNPVDHPHVYDYTAQRQNLKFFSLANHVLLVAVFVLAFKKGYIKIEVVDEENPQEASDDYTI